MRKILFIILIFLSGCSCFSENILQKEIMQHNSAYKKDNQYKIFLMLPLTGKYASSGNTILNGFLSAYDLIYQNKSNIYIKVVDTNNKNIIDLYKRAVLLKSNIIVGPLAKNEIEFLTKIELDIPIITLNTLDNYYGISKHNLYQFGLLPQDEATQVASKLIRNGYTKVAIILPQGLWGEKISYVFKNKYKSIGGNIIDEFNYKSMINISEKLCTFLTNNEKNLCDLKNNNLKKQPLIDNHILRRKDIDSIFLIAKSNDAKQIIPLLKFYYAGDLPIFSISDIYNSEILFPESNKDINEIHFCDMPWILLHDSNNVILNEEIQLYYKKFLEQNKNIHDRLFALGIDTFNIAKNFESFLSLVKKNGVHGFTGKLYIDKYNHIYRKLYWVKIKNGIPIKF